jgi:hypothetical protein
VAEEGLVVCCVEGPEPGQTGNASLMRDIRRLRRLRKWRRSTYAAVAVVVVIGLASHSPLDDGDVFRLGADHAAARGAAPESSTASSQRAASRSDATARLLSVDECDTWSASSSIVTPSTTRRHW